MPRFEVKHETAYQYADQVNLGHNMARLLPLDLPYQRSSAGTLRIDPQPRTTVEHTDHFGNRVVYFSLEELHSRLTVTAFSEVEVDETPFTLPDHSPTLSEISINDTPPNVQQFMLPSPLCENDQEFHAYGADVFLTDRPVHECCSQLMHKIFEDFTYAPGFSGVSTRPQTALQHRQGVCQDFAHVFAAVARSYGLAARYVSGYLETFPPPGQPKLRGADASHAWVGIWIPGSGWVDFDPTNDRLPTGSYVTTAFGRDYSDVPPLRGVVFGGGSHTMYVSVDVHRLST